MQINIKIRWRFVCLCFCTVGVTMTFWTQYLYGKEETFIPFDDELNAIEQDFIQLDVHLHRPSATPLVHFLEGYGHSSIAPRMWCAIEAALEHNPQANVLLHMRAPQLLRTPVAEAVLGRWSNLTVVMLDEEHLFDESPLSGMQERRPWKASKWPLSHYNDVLRWLLLYYYGGVYLDLDSLSSQPLTPPSFPLINFAGLESEDWVGAGVIGVAGPRHWLPEAALRHLAEKFDVSEWGSNGPKLLTRVLEERCHLKPPSAATPRCRDFAVLPPRAFYPIPWWQHQNYTVPDPSGSLWHELLFDPSVKIIHVWYYHTQHQVVHLRPPATRNIRTSQGGEGEVEPTNQQVQANYRSRSKQLKSPSVAGYSHVQDHVSSMKKQKEERAMRNLQPLAAIASVVCPRTVAAAGDFL